MTNVEAAKLGMAIQKTIRGENLQETDPEAYQLYMHYMTLADKASADWHQDREKFVQDSHDNANRPSDEEAVRMREEVNQRFAVHKENARMNSTQKKLFMQDHIKNGPFEELYVEPVVKIGRIGDHQETRLEGRVIGLAGVQLYLEAGLNKKVPTHYAERYRQIKHGEMETEARKALLQGKGIDPTGGPSVQDGWQQVAKGMEKINREYGSSSGSGEAGDSWSTPDLHQPF